MIENIVLRQVLLTDLEVLQSVGKQTFLEAFAEDNSEENMQKYLEEGFSRNRLKAELENPDSMFYFATLNHQVIGYLKLNVGAAQTELKETQAVEIERIYVLKAYYGKKVGQILYDFALSIAKQRQAEYLWLGVWEKNLRAIHFYQKNGFVEFDKHIFYLGEEAQTDLMMRLKL